MDRQRGRRVSNEREESEGAGRKRRRRHSIQDRGGVIPPSDQIIRLSGGLVLGWHATADGHGVLAALLLLLLQVLVVGHLLLLLIGHVAWVQAGAHVGLGRVDIVSHVLGGLGRDIGSDIAVLVGSGVRGVETGLVVVSDRNKNK